MRKAILKEVLFRKPQHPIPGTWHPLAVYHVPCTLYLLFLTLCLCTISCNQKQVFPKEISPAFYHWKTELSFSESEKTYLRKSNVKKLYLRVFDVDWKGGQAVPLAQLQSETTLPTDIEIIPTLFVTNRTLLNIADADVPNLSNNIYDKIIEINSENNWQVNEVQIDCDWSGQTKSKYFELLHQLQNRLGDIGAVVSATIRLHQIKFYKQTGVPPVHRGMLMFYNMSDLGNWTTDNSILDLAEAKKYLVNFESYPLDLDVALPIFSWGVLFRDGKMIKLINNLAKAEIADTSRFVKLAPHRFEVKKSTYLQAHYLYEGDQIRLEWIEPEQLEEAALMLRDQIRNASMTVSFYHLDSTCIKQHTYEELEKVLEVFETTEDG